MHDGSYVQDKRVLVALAKVQNTHDVLTTAQYVSQYLPKLTTTSETVLWTDDADIKPLRQGLAPSMKPPKRCVPSAASESLASR